MSLARIESHYLPVATGVTLHYLEKGEGKPLVFVPGLSFPGELFEAQIEYFSACYRVLALDPRGQGLSAKTVDGNDYQTHGRDLAAFLEKLDLTDVVLVGWNTGCLEIWSYVRQFGAERLRAIVVTDQPPTPLARREGDWSAGELNTLAPVASTLLTTPVGCRTFFAACIKDVMVQRPPEAAELEYLLDLSGRTPYWITKALYCDAILSDYGEAAAAAAARVPSLMFVADRWQDTVLPYVKAHMPGCETCVMPSGLMFYELPDIWNAALESFLNRLL